MNNKHCTVCGLNEKACLHSLQLKDGNLSLRVTRLLWFFIGVIATGVSLLTFIWIS
jgi:hypothetical protein